MDRSRVASLTSSLVIGFLAFATGCAPMATVDGSSDSGKADNLSDRDDDLVGNGRVGDSCHVDLECANNLGLICLGRTCQRPAGLGAACDSNSECASGACSEWGECVVSGETGARCTGDQNCAQGYYCALVDADPDPGHECRPKVSEGSECYEDNECAEGICDYLFDLGRRACISVTVNHPGEYMGCDYDLHCAQGLVCRPMYSAKNRCVMPGVRGSYCDEHADCIDGLICDPDGICS